MTQKQNLVLAATFSVVAGALAVSAQTTPSPQAPPLAETPAPAAERPTPVAAPPVAVPASPPAVAPTLVAPTPVPMFGTPRRLMDVPILSISKLSEENPFGLVTGEPAGLPQKPPFPESSVSAALFAAVRVDPTGKVVQSRIVRDPVPSIAAESRRSFEQRWTFDPATFGGQPIESWASIRLDLQVDIRPREEQATLTPVTPTTPLPVPLAWGDDTRWFDTFVVNPPTDGTVPLERVEKPPVPKKTKWSADSYKGPFSCKLWIKVGPSGAVEKMIPVQASDPLLIPYLRRTIGGWTLRPAQVKGVPVSSWNELSLTGQISYSIEIKQINNLRKTLATP